MRRVFEQMVLRPLDAFLTSVELLSQGPGGSRTVDGMLSRIVHTLSRSHATRRGARPDGNHAGYGRAGERRPLE
jgi:hypothetical protein